MSEEKKPFKESWTYFVILVVLLTAALAILLSGCATGARVATYLPTEDDETGLVKTTVVEHYVPIFKCRWFKIEAPALAPMDVHIIDGEFSVESKASDLSGIVEGASKK